LGHALFLLAGIPVLLLAVAVVRWLKPPAVRADTTKQGANRSSLKGVVVVVDPGHGGWDGGATRNGLTEAQLTYRTASNLITQLQMQGATVYSTVKSKTLLRLPPGVAEPPIAKPDDARLLIGNEPLHSRRIDNPVELWKRAVVARTLWKRLTPTQRAHCYFISVHYDAIGETWWRGGSVVCDSRCPTPRFATVLKKNMDALKLHGAKASPLKMIRREMGVLNPKYNPFPQKLLLEVATISNAEDRKNATLPDWRNKAVGGIIATIKACEKK
jgi:N-acetylmuramoyl-L-alanine amidase